MTAEALADDLLLRFARGEVPDWTGQDVKLWLVAIDRLIHTQAIAVADWAAAALSRLAPEVALLSRMHLLLRSAPPAMGDAHYDGFQDDPSADLQVIARQGACEVLFAFAGIGGRVGMPLPLAHRWFGRLKVHVVYLRAVNQQAFNEGVRSVGASYEATLDGLWRIVQDLDARAILTYGNSTGGFGALRYGLDLRARSILGFSTGASMVPPLSPLDKLAQRRLRVALDLKPFFLAADPPPRTLLVFSEEHEHDARQARHLSGVPGVTLEALPGSGRHEAVMRAVELGRFAEFLGRMAAP